MSLGLPRGAALIADYDSDTWIKAHADYQAAKAGDEYAAARLVQDMVKPESFDRVRNLFGSDVIFVPVHAMEASGKNQIPNMLALAYATGSGCQGGCGYYPNQQGISHRGQTNGAFVTPCPI